MERTVFITQFLKPFLWIATSMLFLGFFTVIFIPTPQGITVGSTIMMFTILIVVFGYKVIEKNNVSFQKLLGVAIAVEKKDFSARANIHSHDAFEEIGNAMNISLQELENIAVERKSLERIKTEFLSMIGHELRSPMTPMKAQLQMLQRQYLGRLNKQQTEAVRITLRNTDRLDNMLLELLEVTRIETARLKFNFRTLNVEPYIRELLVEMNHVARQKNIKIIDKIKHLPVIELDPDRVAQVLRNLLDNAIKFSLPQTKIIVSAEAVDRTLLFSVQDQGPGISFNKQQRLFEPFYQAEYLFSREHGGSGLGLAICRGIVESQHGRIWCESKEGRGTIFSFTVPFTPVTEPPPIRLLFSPIKQKEFLLSKLFRETLGPVGETEFEDLKRHLTEEELLNYVTQLQEEGILEQEITTQFKEKISVVFHPLQEAKSGI